MTVRENDKILITDGHYKHALGLARHLKSNGWEVWCTGNKYSENRFSRFFNYIPFIEEDDDSNIRFFQDLLEAHNFKCMLPIGASSVNFFSVHESHFSEFTNLVLSERKSVLDAFDKFKMAELVNTLGIKSPKTITAIDWLQNESVLNTNFVIKSRNEFSPGCKTHYFPTRIDGENFLKSLNTETLNNLIVQERISGIGEAFFALYNRGGLLTGYTHRRVRETPLSGGSSTCAETTMCIDTFDSGKIILDNLNWHGAAMVEFKRNSITKDLYLMEINPKLWGSLELGISHGVNFAEAIRAITNNNERFKDGKRRSVRFQWPFDGDLNHLRIRELRKSILGDFINYKVKKNIYVSDPLPLSLRPAFKALRFAMKLRSVKRIRAFYLRSRYRGITAAIFREVEESFGIPMSRKIHVNGKFIVGPQISSIGKIFLKFRGVKSSISLQSEFDDAEHKLDFEYHFRIPCQEYHPLSANQLLAGVKFLKEQVENERTTYIHCREGVSRAPYLLAAYYVSLGYSIDQAFAYISKQRSFINPLDVHIDSIKTNVDLLLRAN